MRVKIRCISLFSFATAAVIVAASNDASAQLDMRNRGSMTKGAEADGSQTKPDQRKLSAGETFRLMLDKLKSNDREINRLFSAMPLGFPELQKQYMEKIDQMEQENKVIQANIDQAALAAFKEAPGADPAVTQRVGRSMSDMIEPQSPKSVFNPGAALEIADIMLDNSQAPNLALLSIAFKASFALEDFDRASLMLDRINAANPDGDLTDARSVLQDMQEKWEREQMLRRLEENNNDSPRVRFETTAGDFVVLLYENHAPNTVANFVSLVEKKFYNDLTFHYVKPGEYVHSGCPNGDSTGGPSYAIPSEYSRDQIRHYFAGTLGMANTGPDTEGSQFVITQQPKPELNGNFTAFGRIIEGFDVVRTMRGVVPAAKLPAGAKLVNQPVVINRATVLFKRDHPYEPQKVAPPANDPLSTELGDLPGLDGTSAGGPIRQSATQDAPPINGGLFTPQQR